MQGRIIQIRPPGFLGLLFLAGLFIGLFFVAKGIFTLLSFMAPVLFALAALIHFQTLINFAKFALGLLRRNPLGGIILIILSIVAYPVLGGYLFFKSILDRKVKRLKQEYQQQKEGEYVDFEELKSEEPIEDLSLPPLEKEKTERTSGTTSQTYKDFF